MMNFSTLFNIGCNTNCSGMDQSSEEEVLVWVFPSHESKTSDLEKPKLALPIHWIDIPEKLKKWHQEVDNWHQEVELNLILTMCW